MDYDIVSILAGSMIGSAIVALGLMAILFALAIYIYFAFAWMKIAKDLKYKYPWLAWIPFANVSMIMQLGGFHWAWIFLVLVPMIGWIGVFIIATAATWKVFEKRKYPGWLSLAPVIDFAPGVTGLGTILYLIIIGIVAWKKP